MSPRACGQNLDLSGLSPVLVQRVSVVGSCMVAKVEPGRAGPPEGAWPNLGWTADTGRTS